MYGGSIRRSAGSGRPDPHTAPTGRSIQALTIGHFLLDSFRGRVPESFFQPKRQYRDCHELHGIGEGGFSTDLRLKTGFGENLPTQSL